MDTLDRYLIRETSAFLAWILVGLAMLFLGIDFLTNFWRTSYPVSTLLLLYAYRIPAALQQFLPIASLMATLIVLTNLSRQNEVLALYSGGISTLRILSTFIALVAFFSTLGFLIFDPLVPLYVRKQILIHRGLDSSSSENLSSFNRTNFWYRSGHMVYNFGQFHAEKNLLQDIKIYLFTPSFYLLERITAKEAHFENGDWVLKEGSVITYPPGLEYPLPMGFKTKRKVIPEKPKDFKTMEMYESTMRLKELRQYIQRNTLFGLDTTPQQITYHERIASVFTPLVLIFLAFPFALKPLRSHSTMTSVAYCFGVVLAYLLATRLSLSVAKAGHISPMLAAWMPNIFFLSISSFRLWRPSG
jgi:lipopolysaccharide export system permease protein